MVAAAEILKDIESQIEAKKNDVIAEIARGEDPILRELSAFEERRGKSLDEAEKRVVFQIGELISEPPGKLDRLIDFLSRTNHSETRQIQNLAHCVPRGLEAINEIESARTETFTVDDYSELLKLCKGETIFFASNIEHLTEYQSSIKRDLKTEELQLIVANVDTNGVRFGRILDALSATVEHVERPLQLGEIKLLAKGFGKLLDRYNIDDDRLEALVEYQSLRSQDQILSQQELEAFAKVSKASGVYGSQTIEVLTGLRGKLDRDLSEDELEDYGLAIARVLNVSSRDVNSGRNWREDMVQYSKEALKEGYVCLSSVLLDLFKQVEKPFSVEDFDRLLIKLMATENRDMYVRDLYLAAGDKSFKDFDQLLVQFEILSPTN